MIVVAGGINTDLRMLALDGAMQLETSNPSRATMEPGGVAANVARNLARLDEEVWLFGQVGTDPLSQHVLEQIARDGVDTSGVLRSDRLPGGLYAALLHRDGTLAVAASAMEATDAIAPSELGEALARIARASALVLDANLPSAVFAALAQAASEARIPVYEEPVSVAKAGRILESALPSFLSTPNTAEYEVLRARPQMASRWTIVTRGAAGCLVVHRGNESASLPARPVVVVDETGAGDALMAGIVHRLGPRAADADDQQVVEAVRAGMRMAEAVVSSTDTVWSRGEDND